MKKLLRLFTPDNQQTRWDEQIHKVTLALRKRRNEATGTTPAKIVLGYELPDYGEWASKLKRLEAEDQRTRDEIIEAVNEHQNLYKDRYAPEGNQPPVTLRVGQRVLVRAKQKRKDVFNFPWIGPYPVTRVISTEVYEVDKNGKLSEIHIDNLRIAPRGNPTIDDESEDSDAPEDGGPDDDDPGEPVRETEALQTVDDPRPDNLAPSETEDQESREGAPTETDVPDSTAVEHQCTQQPSTSQDPKTTLPIRRRRRRVRIEVRDPTPVTTVCGSVQSRVTECVNKQNVSAMTTHYAREFKSTRLKRDLKC